MSTPNTKVIQLLESQEVNYRLLPHSEPVFTVEAAAAQRGVVKEEMVKSILLREKLNSGSARYVMACVTGDARLDPKAVRAYLGGSIPDSGLNTHSAWKRLSFASAEEIQKVTSYLQGAVTPLGLPDEIPVIFDESIARCAKVNISSGDPMAGVELDPQDLIRLARAELAPIKERKE